MQKNQHNSKAIPFAVAAYSIAMAFVEAAVVVYLRKIYYPDGFTIPLKMISQSIYFIELGREAATIVMLAVIGWFSAKNIQGRLAGFMIAFGIWDIFYYVFLKITLHWPSGILDWDILFLLPLPWVGPVLAPVIVSICLIGMGIFVWLRNAQQKALIVSKWHWMLEILAALIIIGSFLTNTKAMINQTILKPFHWEIFIVGLLLGIGVFTNAIDKSWRNEN